MRRTPRAGPPEVSGSLAPEEYARIRELIGSYYSVALTDSGTGVTFKRSHGRCNSPEL